MRLKRRDHGCNRCVRAQSGSGVAEYHPRLAVFRENFAFTISNSGYVTSKTSQYQPDIDRQCAAKTSRFWAVARFVGVIHGKRARRGGRKGVRSESLNRVNLCQISLSCYVSGNQCRQRPGSVMSDKAKISARIKGRSANDHRVRCGMYVLERRGGELCCATRCFATRVALRWRRSSRRWEDLKASCGGRVPEETVTL